MASATDPHAQLYALRLVYPVQEADRVIVLPEGTASRVIMVISPLSFLSEVLFDRLHDIR